jgi:hypothetical protein
MTTSADPRGCPFSPSGHALSGGVDGRLADRAEKNEG